MSPMLKKGELLMAVQQRFPLITVNWLRVQFGDSPEISVTGTAQQLIDSGFASDPMFARLPPCGSSTYSYGRNRRRGLPVDFGNLCVEMRRLPTDPVTYRVRRWWPHDEDLGKGYRDLGIEPPQPEAPTRDFETRARGVGRSERPALWTSRENVIFVNWANVRAQRS